MNWLHTVLINGAGHLYATTFGQIFNEMLVCHIPVNDSRDTSFKTVNDQRAKFHASPDFERRVWIFQLAPQALPCCHLLLTTPRIFIQRNIKFLNEIFPIPLDEPRTILRKVLAGFSDEITESLKDVITDAVGFRHSSLAYDASNLRIEILSVSFKPQVERHMIDAGYNIIDFLNRYADIVGQLFRRMRNTMAKPHGAHL